MNSKTTIPILLALLIWVALFGCTPATAQTKPTEIKPSIRLEQSEVIGIIAQLDTATTIISRSDAVKQDRNASIDRLNAIRQFLIAKFEQQNKQDTTKAVTGGKGK